MLMAVSEHSMYANQIVDMRPKNIFLNKLLLLCLIFPLCTCNDTLTSSKSYINGDVLVSSGKNFALGFFSPGNSTYCYLGIWFNKIPGQIVVWVANRDSPIKNNSSGVLKINSQGNLVLLDKETNTTVWSTNLPITTGNSNSIAKLLDSGNLVLTRNDSKNFVWQSFDYPTDTLLPSMKLGLRPRLGLNWSLTSWKSSDDPGNGKYSYVLEPQGSPQFFLYKGSDRLWRSGPWNGQRLSAMPELILPELFNYRFFNTPDEISMMSVAANNSIFSRLLLNDTGSVQRQVWNEENHRWNTLWSTSRDRCDSYAICGAYGSCGNNYPIQCSCLPGFEPKVPQDWNLGYGSDGCTRKRVAQCRNGDGFRQLLHLKVPDTSIAQVDMSLSLEECKEECLRNCNCTAYTTADIRGGGSGCMAWYGDLTDIREFISGGQDLFLRVDATELDSAANASKDSKGFHGKRKTLIVVLVFLLGGLFLLVIGGCCFVKKGRKRKGDRGGAQQGMPLFNFPSNSARLNDPPSAMELEETMTSPELPFFSLNIIIAATDNFSPINKLGQGGFGPVYKGQLSNGQEIAIKRLSKSSGQGVEEFKNEVMLITKLQHRNLVKILGCCIHNEEKMLIYEYMPNKSLDYFIFDKTRRASLDWSNRAKIIVGIARGVLYLHQDSRLRIIHRDLKPSNILLDANMNPKISDFGIARICGGDHTQENTRRVVGTYGYMSPEYAIDGLFSVKSDVFSFGVLLLEIISGKRSSGCYLEDTDMNLIAYVWRLWTEDIALDIVDPCLGDAYPPREILRCIQVGLLCVQESPSDRPTMSNVIFMLVNETNLSLPKRPAFVDYRTFDDARSSATGTGTGTGTASGSINDVTITTTEAR